MNYFENLTINQYKSNVNNLDKSIAEILISELTAVKGLIVIEREKLQNIIAEQSLSLSELYSDKKALLIGELLASQFIVFGSYQYDTSTIRISYRVVSTESGTIIHAETSKNSLDNIFQMIVKMAMQIAKKLGGIYPENKQTNDPLVTVSFQAVLSYANSISHYDKGDYQQAKQHLLKSLQYAPDFYLAQENIRELDERLSLYNSIHDDALGKQIKTMADDISNQKIDETGLSLFFSKLMASYRYRELLYLLKQVKQYPPKKNPNSYMSFSELSQYYLVLCYYMLKKNDQLLLEGELYLKSYPTGMYFTTVKGYMDQIVEQHKTVMANRKKIEPVLNKLKKDFEEKNISEKEYNYQKITAYFQQTLYEEITKDCIYFVKLLDEKNQLQNDAVYYYIIQAMNYTGQFQEARNLYGRFKATYPKSQYIVTMKSLINYMPK